MCVGASGTLASRAEFLSALGAAAALPSLATKGCAAFVAMVEAAAH